MTTTVEYTRAGGRRHTYRITVDDRGRFTIALGDRILKRGCDSLVMHGCREPGSAVQASSLHHAKIAVDYLVGMRED